MNTDRIEKQVVLRAPLDRVWRAISDSQEFGQWFGVRIDGPFVAGTSVNATITGTTVDEEVAEMQRPHAGAEATWQIVAVEPPRRFAYRWHPFAVDGASTTATSRPRWSSSPCRKRPTVCCSGSSSPDSTPSPSPAAPTRSKPTAEDGPSRPNWCASTSAWGSGCDRDARGGSGIQRTGRRNRLRIVVRLCDGGPSSTSQVTQAVSVTRQAATKHLELLEAAGLVISSRRGRERIWTLQTRPLIDAGDYLNQLSRRWDAAIDRLRTFVED